MLSEKPLKNIEKKLRLVYIENKNLKFFIYKSRCFYVIIINMINIIGVRELNKKGFTLIELLSTIVIISLVVLLAIPIYNNVTGKTKERAYESKIKLVEVAAANYAESFKNEIKVNPVPICVSINTLIKNNVLTSDGNNEIYLSNPYTDGVEKTENLLGQVELTYENNEVVAKYSINGTCVVSIGTPDVDDKYVVDVEPPQGAFFINEGDYTNQTTIHLTLNPSDADAKYFCYKDNNVGPCVVYTELSTVNKNNVAYNLVNNTEGIHHVYVWYKDKYNNVGSAMHDQITYDRTLPTGGVQINGGTAYTPTRNVTLNLNYADNLSGVESMCISDTTTCPGANWVIPSASLGWTIPSGEGNHTVSVWYRDRSGNISTRYQATIMLDTVRPTNGTVVINGNATYTASPNVTLTISSSDATSGVLQMCVSQSPTCTSWVGYVTTYNITLTGPQGTNTVYVKYRDRAGNESATQISDTIILDTVNPTCTYTGESTTWTNANRTITTGCIDPTSGCDPVYSGGVTTFTTTTQTGTLTSYTIKDNAGNQVVCTKTANVYVDKTNPTCSYGGESTTWTSADRTITTGCVDTNSLCNASYSGGLTKFTTTTKTGGLTSYTIRDNAGNQAVCTKTANVYVDKSAPTCSISFSACGASATGTCTDSDSLIKSGASSSITPSATMSHSCENYAGLTASCQITKTYDACCSGTTTCVGGDKTCPTIGCGCITYGSSVDYSSTCVESGTPGNQTYTTCSVNSWKCSCGASCYSGSESWTATGNRCTTACVNAQPSSSTGCKYITGTENGVNTYKKTVYNCNLAATCQHADCGWDSCLTTTTTCKAGYK